MSTSRLLPSPGEDDGATAQRGKGGRHDVGWAGGGPAPRNDGGVGEKGALRWDRLGADERRSWSAQIAAKEARAQGLPTLASPAQHRLVAALFAKASTTAPADVAAGEPS